MFDQDLTVDIDKNELLEILKANRTKHREVFEKAVEKYRTKALAILEENIKDILENPGYPTVIAFRLPVPEDHTSDYERVIAMLNMHTGPTIRLGEGKYANYVNDEWSWSKAWAGSTAAYVAE